MVHLCHAGGKPQRLLLTRKNSVRQIGNFYDTVANGMERRLTTSIVVIATPPRESGY